MGNGLVAPCPRCGRRRETRQERKERICRDCYEVDPGWPESVRVLMTSVSVQS
jgi:hypothetical protein